MLFPRTYPSFICPSYWRILAMDALCIYVVYRYFFHNLPTTLRSSSPSHHITSRPNPATSIDHLTSYRSVQWLAATRALSCCHFPQITAVASFLSGVYPIFEEVSKKNPGWDIPSCTSEYSAFRPTFSQKFPLHIITELIFG